MEAGERQGLVYFLRPPICWGALLDGAPGGDPDARPHSSEPIRGSLLADCSSDRLPGKLPLRSGGVEPSEIIPGELAVNKA